MTLEKAASATLIAWILLATAVFALFATLVFAVPNGGSVMMFFVFVLPPIIMAATAWMIDDSKGPLMALDERGMTVSNVFSTGAPIPWSDIEDVKITSWYYNFFFRVPWMSWLVINLRDTSHIGALQWFLPPAWFGRIAIPTRFVKGGTNAARKIVRASQSGLFDGEVARERKAAGTDAMLARGDIAIQRALQARGGFGNFQAQPRTMADIAHGSDGPSSPPVQSPPVPQGYCEPAPVVPASATAPQVYWEDVPQVPQAPAPHPMQTTRQPAEPVMTIQQPAPIMVNGVPYQPQRVGGGFGRKRD
jgi:hypothetical protein